MPRKDMAELSRFAEAGDHEKVAFFAHKLKSASGAIGFNEAYEDFKQIEAAGQGNGPHRRDPAARRGHGLPLHDLHGGH